MTAAPGAGMPAPGRAENPAPAWSLAAALLGFFVVTLDAVIVNVALPDIRRELSGGMSGLQWVADGYTLMFAALLLSAGSLSDRCPCSAPGRSAQPWSSGSRSWWATTGCPSS